MPPLTNGEWTQHEVVRAISAVYKTLERIETKLDDRPDWKDIERIEKARDAGDTQRTESRDREQAAQDVAIKSVEDRLARAMTLAATGLLTTVATAGTLIVNLLNR